MPPPFDERQRRRWEARASRQPRPRRELESVEADSASTNTTSNLEFEGESHSIGVVPPGVLRRRAPGQWITREGRIYLIRDMSTRHLHNTIRLLLDNQRYGTIAFEELAQEYETRDGREAELVERINGARAYAAQQIELEQRHRDAQFLERQQQMREAQEREQQIRAREQQVLDRQVRPEWVVDRRLDRYTVGRWRPGYQPLENPPESSHPPTVGFDPQAGFGSPMLVQLVDPRGGQILLDIYTNRVFDPSGNLLESVVNRVNGVLVIVIRESSPPEPAAPEPILPRRIRE